MNRTTRSQDFYRLLEDWEYNIIDDVDFQVRAIKMGMRAVDFDKLIKWLLDES